MALALVDIYNNAFAKIGVRAVTATTDICAQNTLANTRFSILLNRIVAEYPYFFAKTREVLSTAESTAPAHGYSYKYSLPSGCLVVLPPEDSTIKYSVEGGYLLTDETSFNLIYLKLPSTYEKYDPIFLDVVIYSLASDICYSLTNSNSLQQDIDNKLMVLVNKAKIMTNQQMRDDEKQINITSNFIDCRY